MQVPFYKPALPPYEIIEPEFKEAYLSGMLAPGKFTKRLENAAREYLNVKHTVAFSNCSDSMMCLIGYLKSLTNKTQVIVPNFTFAATWQAVDWNNLQALVADVDLDGLLDLRDTERLLQQNQSVIAILAVHLFGQPAYIDELQELALKYKTYLIFDAAHGMGSLYKGQPLGNSGLAEVFSIGTTKTLAAGEGALLTTNDQQLAQAMIRAAQHGHQYSSLDVEGKSLNGRIQEINSIIGYQGLLRLEKIIQERQTIASYYNQKLTLVKHGNYYLRPINVRKDCRSSYKDYTCFLESVRSITDSELTFLEDYRNKLCAYLAQYNIATKKYYSPSISDLFVVRNNETKTQICQGQNGRRLALTCISLPFFNEITREQQDYVINTIQSFLNQ